MNKKLLEPVLWFVLGVFGISVFNFLIWDWSSETWSFSLLGFTILSVLIIEILFRSKLGARVVWVLTAFQKEYLLRSNKSIVNKGDYTMNKKSSANDAWILLGFPGIPMVLLGFLFSVELSDASFLVVFCISVVTMIAAPLFFWKSNRPLVVGALIGGVISFLITFYVFAVVWACAGGAAC